MSACTLDNLVDNLSSLKFISSNLFVNSWNCFSISESFNKCLVYTSSEFWSSSRFVLVILLSLDTDIVSEKESDE